MGRHAIVKRRKLTQPIQLVASEILDRLPAVRPADDRANRQQHKIGESMTLVTLDPGIFQGTQNAQEGWLT
jgi:hypothetical protein